MTRNCLRDVSGWPHHREHRTPRRRHCPWSCYCCWAGGRRYWCHPRNSAMVRRRPTMEVSRTIRCCRCGCSYGGWWRGRQRERWKISKSGDKPIRVSRKYAVDGGNPEIPTVGITNCKDRNSGSSNFEKCTRCGEYEMRCIKAVRGGFGIGY